MKDNESWFGFMDRAKKNGISPTMQEEIDKEEKENGFNSDAKKGTRKRQPKK